MEAQQYQVRLRKKLKLEEAYLAEERVEARCEEWFPEGGR